MTRASAAAAASAAAIKLEQSDAVQPGPAQQSQPNAAPTSDAAAHTSNAVAASSKPHAGGVGDENGVAAGAPGAGCTIGATSEGRKVTTSDIQLVQNLIERCLQLYMSQKEVTSALSSQAKVEPGFTQLVWQKLEEQNPEFFRSYYTRLKLKDQIVMFNHILEQQVQMVQKLQRSYWLPPPPGTMMAQPARPGAPPMAPMQQPGMQPYPGAQQPYPIPGDPSTGGDAAAAGFCTSQALANGGYAQDGSGGMVSGAMDSSMVPPMPTLYDPLFQGFPGMPPGVGQGGMPHGPGDLSGDLSGLAHLSPDLPMLGAFPALGVGSVVGVGAGASASLSWAPIGDALDLTLPRNFSLSDLNFDLQHTDLPVAGDLGLPPVPADIPSGVTSVGGSGVGGPNGVVVIGGQSDAMDGAGGDGGSGMDGGLPRNFSLSELAPLDVDSHE